MNPSGNKGRLRGDIEGIFSQNVSKVEEGDGHSKGENKGEIILFSLAEKCFGLFTNCILEVLPPPPKVHPLPCVPPHISGLIYWRQELIPLLHLEKLFHFDHNKKSERPKVLVVEHGDMRVGLEVDKILALSEIGEGEIQPPSEKTNQECSSGMIEIEGEVYILLSVEEVFRKARPG